MRHNSQFLLNIVDKLQSMNYHFALDILNSADYGVPQDRRRVFIIGSRTLNKIIFPRKSNKEYLKNVIKELNNEVPRYISIPFFNRPITAFEALDDIAYSEVKYNPTNYRKRPKNTYQKFMRSDSLNLNNHRTTRHRKKTQYAFSKFKPGQRLKDIPPEYRINNRRSVMRISPSKPTRTITSCPEDFIHYSLDRIITIREMARLQSYPDTYIFYGPSTTGGQRRHSDCCQSQQVGNSVPPLLAHAVAKGVLRMLEIKSINKISLS